MASLKLSATRVPVARPLGRAAARGRALPLITARRTVSSRAAQNPNFVLDEPERLWEIGSSYWLPFAGYSAPEYLDGSLPGDRGFDPFRLGATWGSPPNGRTDTQSRLGWLLEGELYNGRVAMLGVVGVLAVELAGKGPWWGIPYQYNLASNGFLALVVITHVCFALLEKKRLENYAEKGEAGHFGVAPFDPFGATTDYNRQAEVRNCRLAMLSFLGFATQAWVTGKGPVQNAIDHVRDPFGQNILTQGSKGLTVVAVFLAFSGAMHLAESAASAKEKKKVAAA